MGLCVIVNSIQFYFIPLSTTDIASKQTYRNTKAYKEAGSLHQCPISFSEDSQMSINMYFGIAAVFYP